MKLEGLRQGVQNIAVILNESSITMEGHNTFEFSFDIEMARITGNHWNSFFADTALNWFKWLESVSGDYTLNGSVGSVIPLINDGEFVADLAQPIKLYCQASLLSKNGFLDLGACPVSRVTLSAADATIDFKGLAESSNSSRLDALLVKDMYERMLDDSITYGNLRYIITDALMGSIWYYMPTELEVRVSQFNRVSHL